MASRRDWRRAAAGTANSAVTSATTAATSTGAISRPDAPCRALAEQVVDEARHALDGALHELGGATEIGRLRVGIGERHVEVRPDHRQRVAQLVGRLLDETALTLERLVESAEHRVERVGQVLELIGRAPQGDAAREVGGLDVAGDAR